MTQFLMWCCQQRFWQVNSENKKTRGIFFLNYCSQIKNISQWVSYYSAYSVNYFGLYLKTTPSKNTYHIMSSWFSHQGEIKSVRRLRYRRAPVKINLGCALKSFTNDLWSQQKLNNTFNIWHQSDQHSVWTSLRSLHAVIYFCLQLQRLSVQSKHPPSFGCNTHDITHLKQ